MARPSYQPTRPSSSRVPLLGRLLPEPVAVKVPAVMVLFWAAKVFTTAAGEATSDYLKTFGNFGGGGLEVLLFLVGIVLQFGVRRYRALCYWWFAFAIAVAGCGFSDFLHLDVHIPYIGTTMLWAVILAAIFVVWHMSEHTLSIHSIVTRRREAFYWSTVFATFALGTALGDLTAMSLHLGYLPSGLLFTALILVPLGAWRLRRLNSVVAFWWAYILTRPLGASFADYISKPASTSGAGFGDGPTALVLTAMVAVVVVYLALVRPDVQRPGGSEAEHAVGRPAHVDPADHGDRGTTTPP